MTEDDLMRPLRQFMSHPGRINDRAAIALLPAMDSLTKQDQQAIKLLERFGVYTLRFGRVTTGGDTAIPSSLEFQRVMRPESEVEFLEDIYQGFVTKLAKVLSNEKEKERIENLSEFVDGLLKEKTAFDFWIGRSAPKSPITEIEGISTAESGSDPNKALSLDLPFKVFRFVILRLLALEQTDQARSLQLADLLWGAWDEILMKFLCARLVRLRWELDEWRTSTSTLPLGRRILG
jgi:hypothetical protein